jgi:hypothetical protein
VSCRTVFAKCPPSPPEGGSVWGPMGLGLSLLVGLGSRLSITSFSLATCSVGLSAASLRRPLRTQGGVQGISYCSQADPVIPMLKAKDTSFFSVSDFALHSQCNMFGLLQRERRVDSSLLIHLLPFHSASEHSTSPSPFPGAKALSLLLGACFPP